MRFCGPPNLPPSLTPRSHAPGRSAVSKSSRSHTPHTKGYKAGAHLVDVTPLCNILAIDESARTVTVEGQVCMRALCEATLAHCLVIPVVPELSDFTVAGLVNGLGIQSSSHAHGLFPDALLALEVVLGSGEVVVATADNEHAALFHDLPGSYGSLGIVVAATLALVPAAAFVRSRYYRFDDLHAFSAAVGAVVTVPGDAGARAAPAFVEGFVFSPSCAVLVCSEWAAHPGGRNALWSSTEAGEEWYHHHALSMAGRGAPSPSTALLPGIPFGEDASTACDYLFRLERGFWWVVEQIVGLPALTSPGGLAGAFGIDRRLRRAVDDAVSREVAGLPTGAGSWMGQSAHAGWTPSDMHRCLVHQDMGVRLSRLEETLVYTVERLGVYPIWVCPVQVLKAEGALWNAGWRHVAGEGSGFPLMAVDVGLYGEPTVPGFRARSAIRALQRFVDMPSFWGMSYLTRAELEGVYDFPAYAATRAAYRAGIKGGQGSPAFPHIADKTSFWDANAPDLPPLHLWRLQRAGIYWQSLAAVTVIAAATVAGFAAVVRHARS